MYSLPANTLAVSGDPISSTKFNSLVQDLEADANLDRPVAAGGTGASTAAGARTNLGITGNLYDVTASAFALTILDDADASAVRTTIGAGTGSGDLLAANNLSDLANAGTARSNLGLAIGTNVQAYSARLADVSGLAVTDGGFIVGNGTNFVLETGATAQASLGYTASDVLSKLLTVDGAGSGLDADTLDGVQGSGFAQLAATNVFSVANATTDVLRLTNSGDSKRLHLRAGEVASQNADLLLDAEDGNNILFQTSGTTRALVGPTGLQARPMPASETSGTLTSASANKTIQATGDITIANSVFAAGDCILIYAGASSRTITQGSGVTMRLGGTATTGSRSLAARGVAVLFFVSASEVVVSGSGVT